VLTGYGLGDQHPWRPSSPFDSLPSSDHDRVHQNASSSICLAFVCQKNTLRNSFHPAFPMTTTVTCQSKSCPNGNPPSRLECPTCNKLFYFPLVVSERTHLFVCESDSRSKVLFSVVRSVSRVLVSIFSPRVDKSDPDSQG